ncbi:MAG: sulfatase-like hydrolase/transferase [Acidimicrobiia bacterium]|nr:sulfatase-like hydrolase/transferase [Acidimicrobiia bacterium]
MSPGPITDVLFCVADQWRADALGVLGTAGVRTPNLDALAAEGVLFANHWCQASPCGPARASLLTGTAVSTHGQWTNDDAARPDLATLAETLRSAGVSPILVGYTDTPQHPTAAGAGDPARWSELVDPAFDVAFPFIWQHGFPAWRAVLAERGYDVDTDHPFGLYAPDGEPDTDSLAPARYRADDSDVAVLTDAAIEVLDRRETPSLLHLTWLRPHPPLTPPRPYHRLVDPDEVALPQRPLPVDVEATRHPYFQLTVPGRSMTEYLQRRCRLDDVGERDDRLIRAAYYGLVAEVDEQFGRLVAELRRRDRYDTTLIVVTSDHGDALGDHWIYGRRGPFDGHAQVPCIVRDPRPSADSTRGTMVGELTTNIDLLPTICGVLGIDPPGSAEGRSLEPFLDDAPLPGWRDHVRFDMSFHDHARAAGAATPADSPAGNRFTMVRTADHRLVRFHELPPLLFDLADDPHETIDRAADADYRPVLADLLDLIGGPAGS